MLILKTMMILEYLDAYPIEDGPAHTIERNEELLLSQPQALPMKLLQHDLLGAVHFPLEFSPSGFAPPRGVYECDYLRLEWQQMNNLRQPFYHRNADVDEISYQVCGERTLMTENGTVELTAGDYSRIPVGVAHDNYGRADIHLLFYVPATVAECGPVDKKAAFKLPPFPEWKSKTVTEVLTDCLGGPECDLAASQADETMLLNHAKHVSDIQLLSVLRPTLSSKGQTEWKYKSKHVWIGHTELAKSTGDVVYRRHRRADEIQCQISGKRTLISQRGIIHLQTGDFICIPNGVAFTELVHENSTHITVLTFNSPTAKAKIVKSAEPPTMEAVRTARQNI